MSLSDTLARRPGLTNGISVLVIVAAAAFTIVDYRRPQGIPTGARLFFSTDEGRTTFADSATRLSPFDHDGLPAVRAYVYACGGQRFVAYVERSTPEGLRRLEEDRRRGVPSADIDFVVAEETEVKRPGDATWVKRASAAGAAILNVKCPDDAGGTPETVLPDD